MALDLETIGDVYILRMEAGENRFNSQSLSRLHELLDVVENHKSASALVTTGTGKFYSNGLDLEWAAQQSEWSFADLAMNAQRLLARTLLFPRPMVAAINGHCFAAGAMWSLAHDFRVMRNDRGFWCLPEIDIHIPFTAGMAALIQARTSPQAAHTTMTTGRRLGGDDALALGLVDQSVPEADVVQAAVAVASDLAAKDAATLGAIKKTMYQPVVDLLLGG